jgi:hypothetical protein
MYCFDITHYAMMYGYYSMSRTNAPLTSPLRLHTAVLEVTVINMSAIDHHVLVHNTDILSTTLQRQQHNEAYKAKSCDALRVVVCQKPIDHYWFAVCSCAIVYLTTGY